MGSLRGYRCSRGHEWPFDGKQTLGMGCPECGVQAIEMISLCPHCGTGFTEEELDAPTQNGPRRGR